MELNSYISTTWKLCATGSFLGCLIFLFLYNQSYRSLSFSAARITVLDFVPFDGAVAPMPAMIFKPPTRYVSMTNKTSSVYNKSLVSLKNLVQSTKTVSNLIEKRPVSTLLNIVTMPSVSMEELINPTNKTSVRNCNMFDGRWVYKPDESPDYDTNSCPFVEEKMSCRKNGRPDFEYEKWKWEAKDCNIPLFNGRDMLERVRNKRVIIVGDSLNRNMWQSLSCLLYTSIPSSRVEVHAESPMYKVMKAKNYNTIIEFHWSPFLIEFDENHKSRKKVLVLDQVSSNSKQWRGADVMVFNSGYWWSHTGKFKMWDLIQYKGQLLEDMPIELAYDLGMKTWAEWIEENVDPKKTSVFFRSISAVHVGKHWCYNLTTPIKGNDSYKSSFPKSLINIIENTIKSMNKTQVKYLNITKLTEYRIDAHPSVYRSSWKWKVYTTKYKRFLPSYADCSHWCLPGLPDTWNRLLYASLFFDTSKNMSSW